MTRKVSIDKAKAQFVEAMKRGDSVNQACKDLDVRMSVPYLWKKNDKQFASDWKEAVIATAEIRAERMRNINRDKAPAPSRFPKSPLLNGNKKDDGHTMAVFLEALATGSTPTTAAEQAQMSFATARVWRKNDPEFAQAWTDAVEMGLDKLEDEARRRAFDGVLEPVFQGGQEVGFIRKYSDTLMVFLLRARRYNTARMELAVNAAPKQEGQPTLQETLERLEKLGLPMPLLDTDYEDEEPSGAGP